MSFFKELKRRNVIRMAMLYVVVAWLVLQVTDVPLDVLKRPSAWARLVLAILILRFLLALVFSWAYELTPEGLKRESAVNRSSSTAHITARPLDYITIGFVVMALLVFAIDRFNPRRTLPSPDATVAEINDRIVALDDRPAVRKYLRCKTRSVQ